VRILQDYTTRELLDELQSRFNTLLFAAIKKDSPLIFEGTNSTAEQFVLWQKVEAELTRQLKKEAGINASGKV
jgi:hypothetical protein